MRGTLNLTVDATEDQINGFLRMVNKHHVACVKSQRDIGLQGKNRITVFFILNDELGRSIIEIIEAAEWCGLDIKAIYAIGW